MPQPLLQPSASLLVSPSFVAWLADASFAPLGLMRLMNGGAAVLSVAATTGSDVTVQLRGCGAFLAYSSACPSAVRLNGRPIVCEYDPTDGRLVLTVEPQPEPSVTLTFAYGA